MRTEERFANKQIVIEGLCILCIVRYRERYCNPNENHKSFIRVVGSGSGAGLYKEVENCPVCKQIIPEGSLAIKAKKYFHIDCFKEATKNFSEKIDASARELAVNRL